VKALVRGCSSRDTDYRTMRMDLFPQSWPIATLVPLRLRTTVIAAGTRYGCSERNCPSRSCDCETKKAYSGFRSTRWNERTNKHTKQPNRLPACVPVRPRLTERLVPGTVGTCRRLPAWLFQAPLKGQKDSKLVTFETVFQSPVVSYGLGTLLVVPLVLGFWVQPFFWRGTLLLARARE
jgi:hypothetical protein